MREEQHEVARILLDATEGFGFVLAGGYAIALHGVGDRPSEDIDIFTNVTSATDFATAVDRSARALANAGWRVATTRRGDTFARIVAIRGETRVEVDMGVDYRERPPARMEVGPVLSFRDAAGSKMAALYGRGEVRDYIDVYELTQSRQVSESELLMWADARESQPMDRGVLVERLRAAARLTSDELAVYGIDDAQAARIRSELTTWGQTIAENTAAE